MLFVFVSLVLVLGLLIPLRFIELGGVVDVPIYFGFVHHPTSFALYLVYFLQMHLELALRQWLME